MSLHEPHVKMVAVRPCECSDAGFPMGIHIPTDFDDAGDSVDGRVFVARCDVCRVFESDVSAARFLSVLLGLPYYAYYDNQSEGFYRPYFDITINRALAINLHVGEADTSLCISCITAGVKVPP